MGGILLILMTLFAASSETMIEPIQFFTGILGTALIDLDSVFKELYDAAPAVPPETKMNTIQLIENRGYPVESHQVMTPDGYFLTLHRIPRGKHHTAANRPIVLLLHGILSTSSDWVLYKANESLAFILADAGFDVWLGNLRGNRYLQKHYSMNPDRDKEYWDFSFDEQAQFDLPSMVDIILETTGKDSLQLISHSMGTTVSFAMLARSPDYNQKIKMYHALAPAVRLDHSKSILVPLVAPIRHPIIVPWLKQLLPGDAASAGRSVINFFAVAFPTLARLWFSTYMFLITGSGPGHMPPANIPIIITHCFYGITVQIMDHFLQVYDKKQFSQYDHGSPEANMKKYGVEQPPLYNMSNVNVPVVLYYGKGDTLVGEDVHLVANLLPKKILKGVIPIGNPPYRHGDFPWKPTASVDLKILIDSVKQIG